MPPKEAEIELIAFAAQMPQVWEGHPWGRTMLKVDQKIFVFS